MILSDTTLLKMGPDLLDPFDPSMVQPASIDMRLGSTFRSLGRSLGPVIDPRQRHTYPVGTVVEGTMDILPGRLLLATTVETVTVPDDLLGRFDGKSSLARLGLLTHVTAGFIDPGFHGPITLELFNLGLTPIRLTPGMAIGQLSFEQMDAPAARPYGSEGLGSKYQNQVGPTPSKYAGT